MYMGDCTVALFLYMSYNWHMKYASNVESVLSRRAYPEICQWWRRTTSSQKLPLSKYFTDLAPSGKFHAKEVTNYSFDKRDMMDFRMGACSVTIETPDDVSTLRPDDVVMFEGVMYRVESKNKRKIRKTRECMRVPLFVYVMTLVR